PHPGGSPGNGAGIVEGHEASRLPRWWSGWGLRRDIDDGDLDLFLRGGIDTPARPGAPVRLPEIGGCPAHLEAARRSRADGRGTGGDRPEQPGQRLLRRPLPGPVYRRGGGGRQSNGGRAAAKVPAVRPAGRGPVARGNPERVPGCRAREERPGLRPGPRTAGFSGGAPRTAKGQGAGRRPVDSLRAGPAHRRLPVNQGKGCFLQDSEPPSRAFRWFTPPTLPAPSTRRSPLTCRATAV